MPPSAEPSRESGGSHHDHNYRAAAAQDHGSVEALLAELKTIRQYIFFKEIERSFQAGMLCCIEIIGNMWAEGMEARHLGRAERNIFRRERARLERVQESYSHDASVTDGYLRAAMEERSRVLSQLDDAGVDYSRTSTPDFSDDEIV